ncbi:MAG TPA: hypothetical protein VHH09_06630 [Acidimicrobiales bacterium]|nr:hypothetical protein [Acidimicrobiales bacterium]
MEPDNHVELYSNETYPTADDAREWARRAYPEVPFGEDDEDGGDEEDEEKDPEDAKDAKEEPGGG